jgi:multiple sugar transport system permease protein
MATETATEETNTGYGSLSQLITSRRVFPYLLLLPAALWLLSIYLYPLGRTVWLSFTDAGLIQGGTFIGLQNYQQLLSGPFVETIKRTGVWTFGSVIPATFLGLIGALALNQEFRGRRLFLGLILIPYAVPLAIVGFLWLMMYNPQFGMLNVIFERIGLIDGPVGFLSYENALFSVVVARIWRATPFALIIYYARLKSISQDLYDAARMDGAGAWTQFRYVTLPELTRVTTIILIVLTVWTTLIFDIVFTMTGGGPIDATMIIPVSIYNTTFGGFDLGLAAAQAMITVAMLTVVTVIYWRISDISE